MSKAFLVVATMAKSLLLIAGFFLLFSGFNFARYADLLLLGPKIQLVEKTAAESNLTPFEIVPESPPPFINSRGYLLYDRERATVLASEQGEASVPIASLTKLMTALVTRHTFEPEAAVTIPAKAVLQIGSVVGLEANEVMTAENLLTGMLVRSGNDAAQALANAHPDGVAGFVRSMNEEARRLGLNSTYFADPTGLSSSNRSSASDLLVLAQHVLNDPMLHRITGLAEATVTDTTGERFHQVKSSNRLLHDLPYEGANGIKTGFTPEAGHHLIASARRNGRTLVAIILSTYVDSKDASAREAAKLLDWGFKVSEPRASSS